MNLTSSKIFPVRLSTQVFSIILTTEYRADVSLYVGSNFATKSQLKENHEFAFTAPVWREVAKLEKKLI